jgi:hypothetical protein
MITVSGFKKYSIILIAIAALFVFGAFSQASAQNDVINNKLSETKDDVNKLLNIRDDASLTASQKERLEIELKIKIIYNVIDVSLNQVQTAREQLEKISVPDTDEWKNTKEFLFNLLDQGKKYYLDTRKAFEDAAGMGSADLNDFAKKLEAKKTSDIDLDVQKVNVVIAELNVGSVLSVADERLAKVSSDVDKIYGKKLAKNPSLKNLLGQASDAVKKAHDLDDQARSIIINIYTDDASTSTINFISALKEKILSDKEKTVSASSTAAKAKPTVTQHDLDDYLADLTTQAYGSIRNAYEIFVKMSVNVKKYLN